ncbi:MAG TPA: glycogen debranching N-terminal domain-containing protein [Acidimicrobiales bacterium]|nr:glycogen debranching N-terminal domain-containing protein [Acidimicrobiales bacterium]
MTQAWAYGGSPNVGGSGSVTLVEGATFCICAPNGDIRPGAEQGLFFRDTRFLSRFQLTVDGLELEALAAQCPAPYAGTFICRRPPRAGTADSTLLVVRHRYVGNGMREDVVVRNLGRETAAVLLLLEVDADFAGLFEVKEGRARRRDSIEVSASASDLSMSYQFGGDSRAVRVSGDTGAKAVPSQITWQLVVDPRAHATVSVQVIPAQDGVEVLPRYAPGQPIELSQPAARHEAWRQAAPLVSTPEERLGDLLATSAEDIGALRMFDPDHPDRVVVAAGVPWFMTLFGRDSLLTSWMLLPVDPTVALGTLQTLAQLQGDKVDPLTEEEPGRILHEVRAGPDAEMALGGGNLYYGSIDSTPLFVMLLGELRRWGLATSEVDALIPHADRALEWMEQFGDRDDDGFIEYQRATDRGLVNQGWKDSFDGINFAAGDLAQPPIALAEVQGYAYAAFLARAHFAREAGDVDLAHHWSERARRLKKQFNESFWLPDRGYFAVALDAEKRQVDALASNMGHCLWTGIVDEDKAASVVRHIMSPEMFTGFGVRTLASTMGAYNPMSYHNGSVWPHDNAIVAAGLMRYGFVTETQRIVLGLLDASEQIRSRLPELFCGFDRQDFNLPVAYPTSCSPQAWSAAAPLYLLRTLLRFDPWVPFGKVWCDPAVPEEFLPLRIDRIDLAGNKVSIDITNDGWHVTGLPEGMVLEPTARHPITATEAGLDLDS